MTNKSIHLLISGPIRPNIDYINYFIKSLKNTFSNFDVKVYLCFWKSKSIDKNNIKNVDYLYEVDEPDENYIFENITSRTIQQTQIELEHWTKNIYKCLYCIKNMIENIDNIIDDDDIVIRIRSDLHVNNFNNLDLTKLFNNVTNDSYFFCPKRMCGNSCDWFGISKYSTFKKIWYVKSVEEHNNLIKTLWNLEDIVIKRAKFYNIKLYDIKNILELKICRSFNHINDMKLATIN